MRSGPSRLIVFGIAVFICVVLIGVSLTGLLGPAEGLLAIPLGFLQGLSRGATVRVSNAVNTVSDYQSLEQRNADLERALVNFQQEIVQLREIKADYPRLSALLNYKNANADQQLLAANVIARDTPGLLRPTTIHPATHATPKQGMPPVTALPP